MLATVPNQEWHPQDSKALQCGKHLTSEGGLPASQATSAAEALLSIAGLFDGFEHQREFSSESKDSPSTSPAPSSEGEDTDCEEDIWASQKNEDQQNALMLLSRPPPRRTLSTGVSTTNGASEEEAAPVPSRKRNSKPEPVNGCMRKKAKKVVVEEGTAPGASDGVPTIGIYTKAQRQEKIRRYQEKKAKRKFNKKVIYHCRKAFADRRPRVGGRFVSAKSKAPTSAPALTPVPAAAAPPAAAAAPSTSRRGRPRKSRGEDSV